MQPFPSQAPGVYAGPGLATLLRVNQQKFLFQNQAIVAGQQSIAVQLDRMPGPSYPWGVAMQVQFSGAPGTFEIDLQGSETDETGSYISLVTITAVNSSNFGRCDMTVPFPKYANALVKTLTNVVNTTLIVTR